MGSEASCAGLPSLPPSALGGPGAEDPEDEVGAGGQGAEVGSLWGPPGAGASCMSAPWDTSRADEGLGRDLSSPPGALPPDVSLWRQCGVSSRCTSLQLTRSCHPLGLEPSGSPRFRVPFFLSLPLWGPPAWKAVCPSFPTRRPLTVFRVCAQSQSSGVHTQGRPGVFPCEALPLPGALSRHRHRAVTGPCLHFQGTELLRAWIPLC